MDAWIRALKALAGDWPAQAAPYFRETWGLDRGFALRVGLLYLALHYAGLSPRITSGHRDPSKQAAMRAAWDRGERSGLRVRPADPSASRHTRPWGQALAVDIPCRDDRLAAQIAKALGLRAGLYFAVSDPGHYDAGGVGGA